jgi:hypothetical protein
MGPLRGVAMIGRLVLGVVYAAMGTFGVAMLLSLQHADTAQDRDIALFAGTAFTLIAIGGLVIVLVIPLLGRRRPEPALGTAPSGAPATFFRRSPLMMMMSTLFTSAFAAWLGGLAVVLHGYGHDVWALLLAACALVLLWPIAVLLTGKVKPGGLWLTPDGLEYRKEAVSWALPWSELVGVDRTGFEAKKAVLPYASGRGVAAVQPLVLELEHSARPEVRQTTWWVWSRECRVPPGLMCIDCVDLAGGRPLIAQTIERYLAHPGTREQLGTEYSLPHHAE